MELVDNKKKFAPQGSIYPGSLPGAAMTGDPMKKIAPIAPAVGGGLAPAFNTGIQGENTRYFGFSQDNAQNAARAAAADVQNGAPSFGAPSSSNRSMVASATPAPAAPTQQNPASAGVDGIPTGGPAGWTGGATQPAPKTAFGDLQSTIQNQVEKAVWGSTITPSPSTGLPSPQKPSTAPVAQPYRNEVQNYPAGGKVQSPAVTTAPAGVPQRNAAGALTSLGAGTDVVGAGIKKYVVDGKTLYSNMGDDGPGGNLSLMNRGAPTAQNMAAMDALVNRSTAEGAQAVQRMQLNDQVAQAKAINARPNPEYTNPNDLRDPANIAARNQRMDMQIKSGESPQAYDVRMRAIQEAQRLAAMQGNAMADRGLSRDKLLADQQMAQSRLGHDQQQLGLRQQQVGNELATGAQSREAKGMEIAAAKQLQTLRDRFMAATGAEQEALGKQLLTMSGKDPKSGMKENFMVVGGGQEWDAQANSMRNVPQTLIDLRTGKPVGGDVGGAKAPTTAVDFLKKNPSQAQAFKDKYGYLPEGFKQ